MHQMKISNNGIKIIKRLEGFRASVYEDAGGKPTIGYGHLIKPDENFATITEEKAEELLMSDIELAEEAVRKYVKVTLTSAQFDALVSFVFNLGETNFRKSTLLKRLNQGRLYDVPEQILRWHRIGKKPIRGLVMRRAVEAMLFL